MKRMNDGEEMVLPTADKMRLARANKRQKVAKMGKTKSNNVIARNHMAHVNSQMKKCYPDA